MADQMVGLWAEKKVEMTVDEMAVEMVVEMVALKVD